MLLLAWIMFFPVLSALSVSRRRDLRPVVSVEEDPSTPLSSSTAADAAAVLDQMAKDEPEKSFEHLLSALDSQLFSELEADQAMKLYGLGERAFGHGLGQQLERSTGVSRSCFGGTSDDGGTNLSQIGRNKRGSKINMSASSFHLIAMAWIKHWANERDSDAGVRVLDVGTGSGILPAYLKTVLLGAPIPSSKNTDRQAPATVSVLGIDSGQQMAEQARRNLERCSGSHPDIEIQSGDAWMKLEKLPEAAARFDVITVGCAISQDADVAALHGVLQPGGLLIYPFQGAAEDKLPLAYLHKLHKAADGTVTDTKLLPVPFTPCVH